MYSSLTQDLVILWVGVVVIDFAIILFSALDIESKGKYIFGCGLPILLVITAIVITVLRVIGVIHSFGIS